MVHVIIKHKVKDFSKWKLEFDDFSSVRKELGSKGGMLFRSSEDPNALMIIFEWDNVENARKFMGSEELKKKMEKAGVIVKPDIFLLDKVEDVQF